MQNWNFSKIIWISGFIIGAIGIFIQNELLIYTGPIVMGTSAIIFSKTTSEDFLGKYKKISPSLARGLTICVGVIFVLMGVQGLFGIN